MQRKVSLMTVFRYISENVLQFTKKVICKPTQLSNNAGSEVAAGLSQPDQVLEDSRLGWEQSLL